MNDDDTEMEWLKLERKEGEVVLEVECGQKHAIMYVDRLCQGSKGKCIYYDGCWLTPNELQRVSGRQTAKDWKRSIRHRGKSLKLLVARGVLRVHDATCRCRVCAPQSQRRKRSVSDDEEDEVVYIKVAKVDKPPPPPPPPPPPVDRSDDKTPTSEKHPKPIEGAGRKKSDLESVVQKLQKDIEQKVVEAEAVEAKEVEETEPEPTNDEGDSCIRTDLSRLEQFINKRKRTPVKASPVSEASSKSDDRPVYDYSALYKGVGQWPRYTMEYEYAASLFHHYQHLPSASFLSPLTFWSQPYNTTASDNLMAAAANFYSRLQNKSTI